MSNNRIRDLGIKIGSLEPGIYNSITDVENVQVGHSTISNGETRTGVTTILPRGKDSWNNWSFAGSHILNGNGEMTGLSWIKETGLLGGPIGLTNTYQVGLVRDAFIKYTRGHDLPYVGGIELPVVSETWDGWLNDIGAFSVKEEHVFQALDGATGKQVSEGNVGGGTGMICHEFKGGIGTSSRIVESKGKNYTVGVLVQANYGLRRLLRINGTPIKEILGEVEIPLPWDQPNQQNSIVVIISTDAPLIPIQCQRLAQRATIGVAHVGGIGHHTSGDIFLCFSTGNDIHWKLNNEYSLNMLAHNRLSDFFEAVVESTEEAILNALCAAETMTGYKGRTVQALPTEEISRWVNSLDSAKK